MKTMKTITTMIAILFSTLLQAKDSAYDNAMTAALQQFSNAKSISDLQNTANSFARIANVAGDDWLSPYYQTQCLVLMSFMETDKAKKDEFLNEAEVILDNLILTQPNNSEVYAMQSMLYTARLTVDPMSRGQEYMALSGQAYGKALALNPTNPRALYLQLSNEVGMSSFFGEDVSVYCERIQNLYANWDEYNQVEKFHPDWGKRQLEGLMKNCSSEINN
jgi:hypothetical protein